MPRAPLVLLALALLAPAAPAAAVAEAPLLDVVLDAMRARGALPERVTVDDGRGPREAPLADALALLAHVPASRGASGGAVPHDVGVGAREGWNPCYVAAVVTAYTWDGTDPFAVEPSAARVPDAELPCGAGWATWVGEARATLAPGVDGSACLAYEGLAGGWANVPESCHVADFREASIAGRVGTLKVGYCEPTFCFTLQQIFGGTVNAPGTVDTAVVRIS